MTTNQNFQIPPFYQRYVDHVAAMSVLEALDYSQQKFLEVVKIIPEELGTFAYQPEKWTIKELLVHLLDAERIFAYRALCFSRGEKINLPGFDENAYVPESNAHSFSIQEIVNWSINLRTTTRDLYKSFSPDMLNNVGSANDTMLSVRSVGYIIAGHQCHHIGILQQRYLKK